MWNDVETTQDFLNFKIIADTAAKMIKDSNGQPLSIGVSGGWGVGKTSLVQMIGESLSEIDSAKKYIFINFNAWLYQGYDDARMALLQKVADKLIDETNERKSYIDKAKEVIRRINWLRAAKMFAPIAAGVITGGTIAGPVGAFIGTVGVLLNKKQIPNEQELIQLKESYTQIEPDLHKLLNSKEEKSIPKEIAELRLLFEDLLKDLDLNLIVLVDDLDRCLPNTAISTLEAMRLLLFIPKTAFIIAADEQMIRNAVRFHFGNIDLSDELVTSYFDKLIQIPLRVPRLGANEVKGYLILLLADLAHRRGKITELEKNNGQKAIVDILKKSWAGGLTLNLIKQSYGSAASKLSTQIEMADQLANIMATSDHISGNPRLIKRFLNNLIIRESIANAQGMSVSFEELVKLLLFERCGSAAAFEYIVQQVGNSEDGKPNFLKDIESRVSKAEDVTPLLHESWKSPFISEWLKLNPPLADIDLRPLLYLSRDKAASLASFDELSPDGREVLSALSETEGIQQPLIKKIKELGTVESEKILTRMKRKIKNSQWNSDEIIKALHLPKALPELSSSFVTMLNEIPADKRPLSLIPQLKIESWSNQLLTCWLDDENTPEKVKRAINVNKKG